MENFFRMMKQEMFYGHEYKFQTLEELEITMKEYIQSYNNQRITTKLKGLTPIQYRSQSLDQIGLTFTFTMSNFFMFVSSSEVPFRYITSRFA